MKAQEPALGIMKTGDYGRCKVYEVQCNCGNDDDKLTFFVESDELGISVITYTTQKTDWWTDYYKKDKVFKIKNPILCQINYVIRCLLNSVTHRLKLTYNIWVHGYIKYEQCTMMSEQQALNYANTLLTAINDVKNHNTKVEKKKAWTRLWDKFDNII